VVAQTNAQRQAAWRAKHQRNFKRVTISVPPDVTAAVRALEKWMRDLDVRLVSVTAQDPKTGRLTSKKLT
jgi:hypothetical protein